MLVEQAKDQSLQEQAYESTAMSEMLPTAIPVSKPPSRLTYFLTQAYLAFLLLYCMAGYDRRFFFAGCLLALVGKLFLRQRQGQTLVNVRVFESAPKVFVLLFVLIAAIVYIYTSHA